MTHSVLIYLVMTTTEMVVMKNIYISKFSRIASINENFISTILTSFNGVIIAINIILRLVTREMENLSWYYTYNPPHPPDIPYNLRTDVQKNIVR